MNVEYYFSSCPILAKFLVGGLSWVEDQEQNLREQYSMSLREGTIESTYLEQTAIKNFF